MPVMSRRLPLAAALLALALGGCAEPRLRPAQAKRPPVAASALETAGVIATPGRCGESGRTDEKGLGLGDSIVAPFVAPFANILSDFVTNSITAALEYRQRARNAVWHGSTTLPFDASAMTAADGLCLRLFRGAVADARGPRWQGVPVFDAEFDLTWREADESLMLAARPHRVSFADTSAAARGGKFKDVTVLFAFSKTALPHGREHGEPDITGDAQSEAPDLANSMALVRIDLGRLEMGKTYDARLLGLTSGGAILPDEAIRRRRADPPAAMTDLLEGMTLTGVVFESEGESPALRAFIKTWAEQQGSVSSAMSTTLQTVANEGKKEKN